MSTHPIWHDEFSLLEHLSRPGEPLKDFIKSLRSPLVVLGAGGKMGPTLCVMARRAAESVGHSLKVIAISRFSDPAQKEWLESKGITTFAADLMNPEAWEELPDADQVINMVGLKFGTQQNPSLTWAVNTLIPTHLARRYASARIVSLSTGNVYPMVPVESPGATEEDPLTPLGEYANAAVARERVLEYHSQINGTPMALIRLNYAVELRYGVLVDIAAKIWHGKPVDLSTPCLNCIWQADANDMILRSMGLVETPARAWNLTSPETYRVRDLATRFSKAFGKEAVFSGSPSDSALLSDSSRLVERLGEPPTELDDMISWVAEWIRNGGHLLGKATHFEVRNGRY